MPIEFDHQELWEAVIMQALHDAVSPTLDAAFVKEARDWFTVPNDHFNEVCDLAGKCPAKVRQAALKQLEAQPKAKRLCRKGSAQTFTFEGQTLTIAQWASLKGFSPPLIYARLAKGWSHERAMTTPRCRKPHGGVGSDLIEHHRDRRGKRVRHFPETDFSKTKEFTE